jgi:hypothetical protein
MKAFGVFSVVIVRHAIEFDCVDVVMSYEMELGDVEVRVDSEVNKDFLVFVKAGQGILQ